MIEAPFLTIAEVRQEVERIFRRGHRSTLVALFGRGEDDTFDLDGRRWRIVPTRCELDLRELLPRPAEDGREGRAYLVDWTPDTLPLDIGCRLAGGRLHHVARDARLAALFGAREVEAGLAGGALAKLFLSGALPKAPRKIQGLRLSRDEAWRSLLDARPGAPSAALNSLGALIAWAAGQDGGPAFVRHCEADPLWRAVRRELHGWLEGSLGEAGIVIWEAWELGLAGRLQEVLPLLAAARDADDPYAAGQLAGQLAAWLPGLGAEVRRVERALTTEDVLAEALPTSGGRLIATLGRSQALADAAGLGAIAAVSDRLPGGHAAREQALAAAVEAFVQHRGAGDAGPVVEAHARLEAHALDPHLHPDEALREARRGLARAALWLAGRPAPGPSGTRWQPAVDLARGYTEEGGYVEWARQQLRALRGTGEALLAAARTLEAAVVEMLRTDHRSFAGACVSWVEAGKPSSAALPIEDLGKHVIAPFLEGGARRKLLVVLMDGMSQAAATQVLTRLAAVRRWKPVAWRRDGWHGILPLPPVLAAAPTLTEVSRGAFFAGRADPAFGDESTDKHAARWRAHPALTHLMGEDPPPLFLRRNILSGHDLVPELRAAIGGDCRAVAVVVNTIDEELKGSLGITKDYSQGPILALDALLSAAEGSGRAVLLVADHGHVLGDGTRTLPGRLGAGRPGGPRWRALAEGEQPADEEVALPASAWVPLGWDRVAALWDPTVVNRAAHFGEHGGLSLAEAVCPAVLLAHEWLEAEIPEDPALAVRPLPVPDWWDLRVRRAAIPTAPAPSPATADRPAQAPLFAPPPPVTAAAPRPRSPLVESLRRSSVFQAQVEGQPVAEVERVLRWLGALAEAGGTLPSADFAAAAGVRSHQVGGVVARMGLLNADGFAMVEHDHVGRRVVLQRSRLAQHYGVPE